MCSHNCLFQALYRIWGYGITKKHTEKCSEKIIYKNSEFKFIRKRLDFKHLLKFAAYQLQVKIAL